jgi:hypothetical protein
MKAGVCMEQKQSQQLERTDQQTTIPVLPPWPTSVPGPKVTEPPAGMKRVFLRTEQVMEVGYDEAQGKSRVRNEGK